jgi:hypothetical protein
MWTIFYLCTDYFNLLFLDYFLFADRDEYDQTSRHCGSDCDEFNKSSQCSGLQYPSLHICDEKPEYVIESRRI